MAYDPKKVHEYYLKRRKLKGLKKKGKKKKAAKISAKKLFESLSPEQKDQALEAQARINVQKKEFNKKLNELIKNKVKEIQASNMSNEEKAVAAEKIRLQYAEAKKQAATAFKEQYTNELTTISKG